MRPARERSNLRRMHRLLTKTRTIYAEAALRAAVLVMVIVLMIFMGSSAIAHVPSADAHPHDHMPVAASVGTVHGATAVHGHAGMHGDLAQCCDDEPGAPSAFDCAAFCAAMAGCHLQMMPGEVQLGFVAQAAAQGTAKTIARAEFCFAPATPPPKAPV